MLEWGVAVTGWAEGYITEIGYIQGYYPELRPLLMRQALVNQGIEHRWPARLRYLELGFGQGVSLNIHAAAGIGEFWGCDFNPTQVANAQAMAAASGANVRILDASFEELAGRTDLPAFDVIAVHGIWTWVSEVNRRRIVELARRHLAVGGVFYISYNTTPGWSAAMPLRHLLTLHAGCVSAEAQGLPARLEAALDFAQSLADANAAYFRANPAMVEKLKRIRGQPPNYSVHEYLTADSYPMPFAEMARYLSEAKLSFAATTFLLDHVNSICLTADQQKVMQGITHPVLRESVRDYLINQQFRRDLWVKGSRSMAPRERNELLMAQTYALTIVADSVPLKVVGSVGEVELLATVYRPLVDALADQNYSPKSLRQLCTALPALHPQKVAEAVIVLSGAGQVVTTQDVEAARSTASACDRLNAYLIAQAMHAGDVTHLASPVVGGGVAVDRFQQLFLRALKGGKQVPEEWAEEAWMVLAAHGQQLSKGGKLIETPEENLAELGARASAFNAQRLPILRALQVV